MKWNFYLSVLYSDRKSRLHCFDIYDDDCSSKYVFRNNIHNSCQRSLNKKCVLSFFIKSKRSLTILNFEIYKIYPNYICKHSNVSVFYDIKRLIFALIEDDF